jgi:hypothetical protein
VVVCPVEIPVPRLNSAIEVGTIPPGEVAAMKNGWSAFVPSVADVEL